MLRTALNILCWLVTATLLVGVLVRLTVKDGVLPLALAYYATPLSLMSMALLAVACIWAVAGRPGRALVAAGCFGVLLLWWQHEMVLAGRPLPAKTDPPPDVRVLFWNTARGDRGWGDIVPTIRRHQPDLVGIVEGGHGDAATEQFWRTALPDYQMTRVRREMLILSRGEIGAASWTSLPSGGTICRTTVTLRGRRYAVFLVDLLSNPTINRARPIRRLMQLADEQPEQPIIVMGDFNTPSDSVHFAPLRSRFTHALEAAGSGYCATWPVPLPLLAIDHVWTCPRLEVLRCKLGWSWYSDHRPIVADLHVRP